MAEKMTTEQYNSYMADLKSGKLSERDLTDEEREGLYEYEASSYGMPSKSDQEEAAELLNSYAKDPTFHGGFNEEDKKWAEGVINQAKVARDLMISDGKDLWVRKVKEVPDDVIDGYGFKFNWKGAYENETGEKLRPTEADADKLKKYIQGKMDEYEDPENNLKNIAYKMHMTGKTDEDDGHKNMWSNFMASDRFPEFQKYLEDVQKYQKEKSVEKIFSGEDPTKVNYPIIGPTDIPLSKEAVDFMLPVSKEYAKNHYDDVRTEDGFSGYFKGISDIGPAFATDAAANLAMMDLGKGLFHVQKLSKIYENVAAPVITEAGQYALNDKPLPQAVVGSLEGTLVNAGTPMAINRGGNWIERVFSGGNSTVNNVLNRAANKSREVAKKKKDGWIWLENGNVMKSTKNGVEREVEPKPSDLERIIPAEDLKVASIGDRVKRSGKSNKSQITNQMISAKSTTNPELYRTELIKKLSNNQTPTLEDIQLAGFRNKESLTNWLSSLTPDMLKAYATNLGGRAQFGQRGMGSLLNIYAPDLKLFKGNKEDRERGTDKWYRYYGLK